MIDVIVFQTKPGQVTHAYSIYLFIFSMMSIFNVVDTDHYSYNYIALITIILTKKKKKNVTEHIYLHSVSGEIFNGLHEVYSSYTSYFILVGIFLSLKWLKIFHYTLCLKQRSLRKKELYHEMFMSYILK